MAAYRQLDGASAIWDERRVMELADLRAFARVADLKSVTAAAKALSTPKSSISRALARLEAAVGSTLLERSTHHVRLTDAGRLLLPHAIRIMSDVDEAESELGSFIGVPRGTLRVSVSLSFAYSLLAPMVPAFLAKYPEIRIIVDVDHRTVDMLAEEIDLAIRFGTLPNSTLIARKLADLEIWLCANPAYIAARGTPTSVADLAHHDLIGRTEAPSEWHFGAPGQQPESVLISSRAVSAEPAVGVVMIMNGGGIGYLPRFLAEDAVARGLLVRLLPDLNPDRAEIHALYPSRRSLSAKVRVFIDALVDHLATI